MFVLVYKVTRRWEIVNVVCFSINKPENCLNNGSDLLHLRLLGGEYFVILKFSSSSQFSLIKDLNYDLSLAVWIF